MPSTSDTMVKSKDVQDSGVAHNPVGGYKVAIVSLPTDGLNSSLCPVCVLSLTLSLGHLV